MAYSKKVFETAHNRLEQRKTNNKKAAELRHSEVCSAIPEYSALELSLAGTMTRSIAAIAERQADSKEIIARSMEENAEIQQKMTRLLKEKNFPENYMDPIYTCGICHDTGTVDGRWCSCFTELLYSAAASELNASSPLKPSSFESFDLSYYSDRYDENIGDSPRAVMEKNLLDCKNFAKNFRKDSRGLLMLGNTGLGKTHLSLAIASEVIKGGYSVVYNSAPELMRTLNKEFYGRSDNDTMALITSCDLLILDDLGAETKTDQNVSMVYEIINARYNRQLPMIVNSNFNVDEISERYSDRVLSRLLSLHTLFFDGEDNRLMLQGGLYNGKT